MYEFNTQVRVRYAEADPMNVVYYGNYAQYFEVGRVESLRNLGISYKGIEDMGIKLPVVELNIKYLRPAKYDDLLTIKSQIKELPTEHKIIFDQEIYNEEGKLLTIGKVKLYFMDSKLGKRASMPASMLEKLSTYFR
ncbi:MAG: acyl-CoA thioesterase [Chitinophagaceae bacterium]|jgi:acyl-CoA thioester hydrolase|nr:acyl-CoA thioesterase [Chitinophagaceae bacterium]